MEQPRQALYLFQGTITLTSALHVGGGTLNTTNTDNPVVRTPDGAPYIPGSSFKGVFRSTVEKLASTLGLNTCLLRNGKDCFHRKLMEKITTFTITEQSLKNLILKGIPEEIRTALQKIQNDGQIRGGERFFADLNELLGEEQTTQNQTVILEQAETGTATKYEEIKSTLKEKAKKEYPRRTDKHITQEELYEQFLIQEVSNHSCPTCQLFGNGFSASKIFFSDLKLLDWAGVTQVRDGVVIDRDSEKAVEGLKYDFEVVPADATFRFEIRLQNPGRKDGVDVDVGLTCLGLHEFMSGLGHVGGNRSRGLGNCTMKLYKVYHVDLTDSTHLKRYLLHTKLEEKMEEIPDPETFVRNSIAVLI